MFFILYVCTLWAQSYMQKQRVHAREEEKGLPGETEGRTQGSRMSAASSS